ncbi:hypothetical protein ABZ942_28255 [Nocardia sp. NPDC046473]|uniref:hypothetical protein n=1 Tax=Nocardia sp. NPDC046473 TaxID=3155733 RepID=UPI0033D3B441
MRKIVAAIVIGLSGAAAVSSCSSAGRSEQVFSDEEKAMLAERETMRPMDPCGYFDDAAIQRIGTPDDIKLNNTFYACWVTFTPAHPADPARIMVDMDGPTEAYRRQSETQPLTPHQVGDTTVWTFTRQEGACTANVPVNDRRSIEIDAFAGAGRADQPQDQCAAALDLATAIVPHRLERPLRANSPRTQRNSRLAALDPCKALDTIGKRHDPHQYVNTNPWHCAFRLDSDDESSLQNISLEFTVPLGMWNATVTDITISGFRARQYYLPKAASILKRDDCQIVIETPVDGRIGHPEFIDITTGDCAIGRATGEELVRLFDQLPR